MTKFENARIRTYQWSSFECEICKTAFPFKFKTQFTKKKYSLLDYNLEPNQNYLVLESISVDKPTSKSIYIMTPTENNTVYRVGRANDQDLRIGDISSSRAHAQIIFNGSNFTIKDNMSKFGTMVQIKNKLVLKPMQSRII